MASVPASYNACTLKDGVDASVVDRGPREIFASSCMVGGVRTIRVYQAYNERIAASAVAANSFMAPRDQGLWSESRMTWIKPSAAWMAYRCGWSLLKDKNQAAVLALDLDETAFLELLGDAVVTTHGGEGLPKGAYKDKAVVVQWDPERTLDPTLTEQGGDASAGAPYLRKMTDIRSLQVGLRGRASAMLCDPSFVRRICDVTPHFRAAHSSLAQGDLLAARRVLWPTAEVTERRVDVPRELCEVLCMHHGSGVGCYEGHENPI